MLSTSLYVKRNRFSFALEQMGKEDPFSDGNRRRRNFVVIASSFALIAAFIAFYFHYYWGTRILPGGDFVEKGAIETVEVSKKLPGRLKYATLLAVVAVLVAYKKFSSIEKIVKGSEPDIDELPEPNPSEAIPVVAVGAIAICIYFVPQLIVYFFPTLVGSAAVGVVGSSASSVTSSASVDIGLAVHTAKTSAAAAAAASAAAAEGVEVAVVGPQSGFGVQFSYWLYHGIKHCLIVVRSMYPIHF